MLAAWIQRHRGIVEAELCANPQVKLLHSVYFLYTHRSTCQNCEQVSHMLISKTPLLISFFELSDKRVRVRSSDIRELSLTGDDLEHLSGYKNPTNIKNWKKGIVRIPVQYQIGE